MAVYVVSEQTGLDGYWITDILKGIKAEADKKNLRIEDFYLPAEAVGDDECRLVLTVGYTKNWLEQVTGRIREIGARAIVVNASPDCGLSDAGAFVGFDYASAMKRLVSYLKYCGKTHVAFIGCGGRLSFEAKRRALLSAAAEAGVYCECSKSADISEMTSSFMRMCRSFDAVVCSRDAEASHLLAAMAKRKVFVPEDIYVVGIGGNRMSELSVPSCTTLHTDFVKLGAAAVKLHRFLAQNPETHGVSVSVECPLIVRESTENKALPSAFEPTPQRRVGYRTDNDYLSYLRAEELVRSCDKMDRSILLHLASGKNTTEIAEEMFISQSSVKYRIKKMLANADIPDKRELIKIARMYGLL